MAFRVDRGELQPAEELPNGQLRVDAFLTRTGVFVYREPDGTERREFRPESEVFKTDSLATFSNTSVTDDHPTEMVTPENARELTVGMVGANVRKDGDRVRAQLIIFDAGTIGKMKRGKSDVSCGYHCDLDETPGETPSGERFDAIQTNIRGNHVAIVDTGRAGPEISARMDNAAFMIPQSIPAVRLDSEKGSIMEEKLAEALAEAATLKARVDTLEKERDAEKARADGAEGERDSTKKDLEESEKTRTDAENSFDDRMQARVKLEGEAQKVLGKEYKTDGLSDRAVKCAVVKKVDGDDIDKEAGDGYVHGRYIGALKRADDSTDALDGLREATVLEQRNDGAGAAAVAKARQDHKDRQAAAWKKPATA